MFQEITYYYFLGLPFIVYLGGITIFFFILTALLALLKRKGKLKISILWHYRLAFVSILLGVIHAVLGVAIYF